VKKLKIEEDLSNFVQGEFWKEKKFKYLDGKDVLQTCVFYMRRID